MTHKKIALITAPNMRYVNTGMTTVELAAKCFFEKKFQNVDVTFFSFIPPNPKGTKKWMMMDLGYIHHSAKEIENIFRHEPILDNIDNVFSSDLIIYWGDFLQARHYIESEGAGRIADFYKLEKEKALKLAYQILIQSNESDRVRQKTMLFGGSILYNRVHDYISGKYSEYLIQLLKKSPFVMMRDPISAARINHLTKDFSINHLGIDPAFLLDENDLLNLPTTNWAEGIKPKGTIGLFFGTRTEPPKSLFNFCRRLANNLNFELEWIPWFPFHEILRQNNNKSSRKFLSFKKHGMLSQIEDLLPRGDFYTQGDLLNGLRKYAFVITDTYHLCINSWIAGTPVFCFGSESKSGNKVIKNFKKRVLYEMFDAKDYYFDTDTLATKNGQSITEKNIFKLLSDVKQSQAVIDRIASQTSSIRGQLESKITIELLK